MGVKRNKMGKAERGRRGRGKEVERCDELKLKEGVLSRVASAISLKVCGKNLMKH